MRAFSAGLVALAMLLGCGRAPETASMPEASRAFVTSPSVSLRAPRFGDSDPYKWEARNPWSYPVHGIDVSRYQGEIDWPKVRRAGVNFAYLKATEGGDLADPKFKEYWRGAAAAGVQRGAYHYFYFCRPAEEQARWFIKHVPRDPNALPPVLDMEWNPYSKTCTKRPEGHVVRAEARKFLRLLEAHYGRRPVIYTTVDFYQQTGIGRIGGTEFWLRSVAGHPRQTYPGAGWRLWQYSGTGQVPGIEGDVDLNAFSGSAEDWLSWSGQG